MWNVKLLYETRKTHNIIKEMKRLDMKIIGISEFNSEFHFFFERYHLDSSRVALTLKHLNLNLIINVGPTIGIRRRFGLSLSV